MQINISLDADNKDQAEKLRKEKHPNATAKEIRDSFLFNQCIDEFIDDIRILMIYVERDKGRQTVQRMLTIREESNERLKTIASSLKISVAATYRSIIAYSVDKLSGNNIVIDDMTGIKLAAKIQKLQEKVMFLENQLEGCHKTLAEIRNLLCEKE